MDTNVTLEAANEKIEVIMKKNPNGRFRIKWRHKGNESYSTLVSSSTRRDWSLTKGIRTVRKLIENSKHLVK